MIGPRIPMPHEQAVVQAPGGLDLLLRIEFFTRAFERRAILEHLRGEQQRFAIGRELEIVHVERQVRHLHRRAAGNGRRPQLRRILVGGEEVQRLAVRRKSGAVGAELRIGDAPRLGALLRQVEQPHAVDALVGIPVGAAHREGDLKAVRRQVRIGHAIHHREVVRVEGMLRGHGSSRCGGQREHADGKAKVHRRSPAFVENPTLARGDAPHKRGRHRAHRLQRPSHRFSR